MWVLMRLPDGAFVARKGWQSSYVKALQFAQTFATKEQAENNRCPDNEIAVNFEQLMERNSR